jgi:polyisoprenoid-binding protein YceI
MQANKLSRELMEAGEGQFMKTIYLAQLSFLAVTSLLASITKAQVPVFAVTPEQSAIKFSVKASVPIEGHFDRWDASLTFGSTDVTSGALEITIQAATVNTGSGMKDNKLRSKDFFDVKENPLITFKSTKVVQTGPTTFDVPGTFTIRGVSKRR